jgi:hypothetical protein
MKLAFTFPGTATSLLQQFRQYDKYYLAS